MLEKLDAGRPAAEMTELDSADHRRQSGAALRLQIAAPQDFPAGLRFLERDRTLLTQVMQCLQQQ